MTAQPMSTSLAKVRKLLPVRIYAGIPEPEEILLLDRHGFPFCYVPNDPHDGRARAELIRDAMNGMA